MADSDFFKEFCKTYKPKVFDLTPYLRSSKLRGYKIMSQNSDLVPLKTYVKYINKSNALEGYDLSSHIKSGGILLKGGYYANGKFMSDKNSSNWTHLVLKFSPTLPEDDNVHPIEPHIFNIKMDNYHIFYKRFINKGGKKRLFMEDLEVELLEMPK